MATKYYDIVQSDDISVPQSRVEGLLEHTYIPTKKGSGSGDDDSGRTLYIQNKTVTSSFGDQSVTADTGYDYLGKVTVKAMPVSRLVDEDGGIIVTIGSGSDSMIFNESLFNYTNYVIPEEYQEVQYLTCHGNSYITSDLKVAANHIHDIKVRLEEPGSVTGTHRFVGHGSSWWYFQFSGGHLSLYEYDIHATKIILANVKINTDYRVLTGTTRYGTIFTVGNCSSSFYGRIYYFRNYIDGNNITPTINLIPVYRKSDNKAGFYDTIINKFYPNEGSNDFTVGPNKE